MAAAAATPRKRLPNELQEYKKRIKGLDFKGKVKSFFDCAPYIDDFGLQKREICYQALTKEEKRVFESKYRPIHNTIIRHGDTVRAVSERCNILIVYLENALRNRDNALYTGDFLNALLPMLAEAINTTKEEQTKEILERARAFLSSYNDVGRFYIPFKINNKKIKYNVDTADFDVFLARNIKNLIGFLSLLKCYLDSLKEFMKLIGALDLYPKEFEEMEDKIRSRFSGKKGLDNYITKQTNKEKDKFPLFYAENKIAESYISIDYDKLPHTIDIFGEENIWVNTYNALFAY